MKASEAALLVAEIEAIYEHEFPTATREIWTRVIADVALEEAIPAVSLMLRTHRFKPVPADFFAALAAIRPGGPSGIEAWEQVCRSVSAHGWDGDHSDVPAEAREVAEAIGWQAIGMSPTTDTWMQRHFIRHYEARMERRTREQLVSPGLAAGGPLGELAAGLFEPPAMEAGQ